MSKSRSLTPTPNLSPINLASSSDPTSSRPSIHDNTPTRPTERDQQTTPTFTPVRSPSPRAPRARPSPENSPGQSMAKRLRRASPESGGRSHSSTSSDSQGGFADTETDPGQSQRSEPAPSSGAPVKKKRTRTLTTPHQSAVLHALLAQVNEWLIGFMSRDANTSHNSHVFLPQPCERKSAALSD